MKTIITITGWAHKEYAIDPILKNIRNNICVIKTSVTKLNAINNFENNLSGYASGLKKLIDSCPEPPTVLGWSMGAQVALELATVFPMLIKKMIIINGTARFCCAQDYDCGVDSRSLSALLRGVRSNLHEAVSNFIINCYAPITLTIKDGKQLIKDAMDIGETELIAGLKYLKDTDLRLHLPSLITPVDILCGDKDDIIPFAASEYLHKHLPNASFKTFSQCGHALNTSAIKYIQNKISAI